MKINDMLTAVDIHVFNNWGCFMLRCKDGAEYFLKWKEKGNGENDVIIESEAPDDIKEEVKKWILSF